jgi:hypothetical protein
LFLTFVCSFFSLFLKLGRGGKGGYESE